MRTQSITQPHRHHAGMTLVEVLITAVVLAIGLLGVAALQVSSLQGASNAQFRSKATDLTSALVDRIRANLTALDDYPTAAATCGDTVPGVICSMAADDITNTAADCSPSQMAAYDLYYIRCQLENALPGGQLIITRDDNTCPSCCAAKKALQITVNWQTQEDNPDFSTDQVITTIMPGSQIYIPGENEECAD
jgi:type IV pilus assembly protein PilV